jgi:hypothetical protein
MVGEGNGFFSYIGYEEEIEIIVGDGFGSYKNSTSPRSESSMRANRLQNLCAAYGFNLE